jgi:lipopolysaccharide/colanic/teichoic acid biosynthesis glycosyltransferase
VLPGITGRAQISLRYDRSVDDVRRKLELDLQYIERRSVIEDLRIMAGTLPVMLVGRGSL